MPNYYTDRLNAFLKNAESIYDYLSDNRMDRFCNYTVDISDAYLDRINGMMFVQLAEYRKTESDELNHSKFKIAVKDILSSCHSVNCAVGYFIISTKQGIKLFFAAENDDFLRHLPNSVSDAKLIENAPGIVNDFKKCCCSGIVTGASDFDYNFIDGIIDGISGKEAYFAILAKPCSNELGSEYIRNINMLYDYAFSFEQTTESYGDHSGIQVRRRFPQLNNLKSYLSKQTERIINMQSDLWKMCIWFGAANDIDSQTLGRSLAGAFSNNKNTLNKGRCFFMSRNLPAEGALAFPDFDEGEPEYEIPTALKKSGLCSVITNNELASMFQIPMRSHLGISVFGTGTGEREINPFAINPNEISERDSILLAHERETDQEYRISVSDINKHMLITGATGAGKTNTMKVLFEQLLEKNNLNVCIIEPIKKEYWDLIGEFKELKVYSGGSDAHDLRINIFEPEDDIEINSHIDELMQAFNGAFEMEEATRATLKELLEFTYQECGWRLDDRAWSGAGRYYPMLDDMLSNLNNERFRSIVGSSGDASKDIISSVDRRLRTISSGAAGKILNNRTGMGGKDFCTGAVLIELEDLYGNAKTFVTAVLLIRINQFLRQRNPSSMLKNVIVLEEAHEVFADVSNLASNSSKALSTRYFSGMLTSIRSSGTGMIIVDQGASKIDADAVSNTKVKIMHKLQDENDADKEAFAFNLSEMQKKYISGLETGEAIVSVKSSNGLNNALRVRVCKSGVAHAENYGCVFCKNTSNCFFSEAFSRISGHENECMILAGKLAGLRHEPELVKDAADSFFDYYNVRKELRVCALGYILRRYGNDYLNDINNRRLLYSYVNVGR